MPFEASPALHQASQRRFLQPNASKRAPSTSRRSTSIPSPCPPSVVPTAPHAATASTYCCCPTAALQTPPDPSGQNSHTTPTPRHTHTHIRVLKPDPRRLSPSAAPTPPILSRLRLVSSPLNSSPRRTHTHTPCRSHPLPRLRIRPRRKSIDLLEPPVACEPSARLNLSSLAAHSPPSQWRRKYACCSTAHRRSTPMALRPVRPCNAGAPTNPQDLC